MNKRPLIGLSAVVVAVLILAAGSRSAIAQDPNPTPGLPQQPIIPDVAIPQSPQQPSATTSTITFAMSYQGQLQKNGGAYNGTCNFQFSLWDAATGGTQVQSTLTKNNVAVANGLFSVELDFGYGYYLFGDARWLQTSVQCTGDTSYTILSPRQPLNAVPYALGLRPGALVSATNGYGLDGRSKDSVGVNGISVDNFGVAGSSVNGPAGLFESQKSDGVYGYSNATGKRGVTGVNRSDGIGVHGVSNAGVGVRGESNSHDGVQGISHVPGRSGVYGSNDGGGNGLYGDTVNGTGVYGNAKGGGNGVFGGAENGIGGYFYSKTNAAVYAKSDGTYAAYFDGRMRSNVIEIAGGSDLAERFEQADGAKAEPGTLMVADENNAGKLKISNSPYDSKVIVSVSGAGGINTGLTLHQEGALAGDLVVAVAGRVYAKCEAISASIKPGDLLTTSSIPGHCMTASDREHRDGAVIGKAMTGLKEGKGLVLVIVNLQ